MKSGNHCRHVEDAVADRVLAKALQRRRRGVRTMVGELVERACDVAGGEQESMIVGDGDNAAHEPLQIGVGRRFAVEHVENHRRVNAERDDAVVP